LFPDQNNNPKTNMKNFIIAATAASICILVSGCASIVDGGPKTVRINSKPAGANFTVYDQEGKAVASKTTPASVSLERGDGMFRGQNYRVAFEASGYRPGETQIKSEVNGWYYGNIAFGGLIGMLVDGSTGAMWTLSPADITYNLVSSVTSSSAASTDAQSSPNETPQRQTSPDGRQ
jgi:hypothetical protein